MEQRMKILDQIRAENKEARERLVKDRALLARKDVRKIISRVQAALRPVPEASLYCYIYSSVAWINITVSVDSFTDRKLMRLLERIDAVAPFGSTEDTEYGRTFATPYDPSIGVRVSVCASLKNPDEGERCRRVVKAVRAGAPIVEYGYVCN